MSAYTEEQRVQHAAALRKMADNVGKIPPGALAVSMREIADVLDPPPLPKSRGRINYEAWRTAREEPADPTWDRLSDAQRATWERAANAVAVEAVEVAAKTAKETGGFDGDCA